eukprot:scaffold181816_cov41-Prasinocladus_malaysianus.AAC.1
MGSQTEAQCQPLVLPWPCYTPLHAMCANINVTRLERSPGLVSSIYCLIPMYATFVLMRLFIRMPPLLPCELWNKE